MPNPELGVEKEKSVWTQEWILAPQERLVVNQDEVLWDLFEDGVGGKVVLNEMGVAVFEWAVPEMGGQLDQARVVFGSENQYSWIQAVGVGSGARLVLGFDDIGNRGNGAANLRVVDCLNPNGVPVIQSLACEVDRGKPVEFERMLERESKRMMQYSEHTGLDGVFVRYSGFYG